MSSSKMLNSPMGIPGGCLLFLAFAFAAGCAKFGYADCVMPPVRGRVLDAETGRPVSGVWICRSGTWAFGARSAPDHGAEMLVSDRPVITGADGRFTWPARNYAVFWQDTGSRTVNLSFQAKGYAVAQSRFASTADLHQQKTGKVMVIEAGDIFLQPSTK